MAVSSNSVEFDGFRKMFFAAQVVNKPLNPGYRVKHPGTIASPTLT
jgi:hypothetical protein